MSAPDLTPTVAAAGAFVGTILGRIAWDVFAPLLGSRLDRFIRPRAAQPQTGGVQSGDLAQPAPAALEAAEKEIQMAGGSWLNRFLFGPIKAFFGGLAASTDPQVVAAKGSLEHAAQVDLETVNPIIDAGVVAVEGIAAVVLDKLGLAGVAADKLVVNPALQLAGNVLKQAIDHALGINPLPATTSPTEGAGSGS